MKTLHLNLQKKWFDMILAGEKAEEYRDITEYWIKRLQKDFDTITFSNGYAKNRPQFEIEFKNIDIDYGIHKWGAVSYKKYFVLRLGSILNKQNC